MPLIKCRLSKQPISQSPTPEALVAGIILLATKVQKFIGDHGITVVRKIMGLLLAAVPLPNVRDQNQLLPK